MLISLLEVCQEGVLWGNGGFLTEDLEDMLLFDIMNVLGRPQGSYHESFVLLS